jgi:hypothetical protein
VHVPMSNSVLSYDTPMTQASSVNR